MITTRANYFSLAPKAIRILMEQEANLAEQFSDTNSVTQLTWELVKLRVSQINQCAFCIDMHSKSLLELGQPLERIIGLSTWHEMPFYSKEERAALGWAEDLVEGKTINDKAYNQIIELLGEQMIVHLTIAVNAISSWNRIAKTFKPVVGSY